MSEPTPELLKHIDDERLKQARRMHPFEKVMAGIGLYDANLERMSWGIKAQHPELNPHEVRQMVLDRVKQYRAKRDADGN